MNLATIPVVILCGGRGARFDHESQVLPKPLIEVCGRPMLRHIMDSLVDQGFREFIIAAGYLSEEIDRYFAVFGEGPFAYSNGDLRWRQYGLEYPDLCGVKVVVVDTGLNAHTGERVLKLASLIGSRRFVLTYGDGLSDVDMAKVMEKHEKTAHKIWWGEDRPEDPVPALLTLTAVCPEGRFGSVEMWDYDDWGVGGVQSFQEKPRDAWINGGFMVVEPEFIERYLWGPDPVPTLESQAMAAVARDGFMRAYRHKGYWRCMDTRRDLEQIEADVSANGSRMPWRRESK